ADKVQALASKSEATVGEKIEFIINVVSSGKISFTFPEKKVYLLSDVALVKEKKTTSDIEEESLPAYVVEDVSMRDENGMYEGRIVVRYFSPGMFFMPSFSIQENQRLNLKATR
ncbi:MAG: hypothetical protein HGA49_12845, partial [Eubacteriaceae bacterium]|nr:hypothetical protein [Eubacteriaceae bacterium]